MLELFTQMSLSALNHCGTTILKFLVKNMLALIFRLYKNGFMKTLPVFSEFNMRDLLPLKVSSYTAIDANADTSSEYSC